MKHDFKCPIVNFPAAPTYGVFISELICYYRAYVSYQYFLGRGLLLTRKLLTQVFLTIAIMTWLTVDDYEYALFVIVRIPTLFHSSSDFLH